MGRTREIDLPSETVADVAMPYADPESSHGLPEDLWKLAKEGAVLRACRQARRPGWSSGAFAAACLVS